MEHPIKMDDLGVPLFLETPKSTVFFGGNTRFQRFFPKEHLDLPIFERIFFWVENLEQKTGLYGCVYLDRGYHLFRNL